MGEETHSCMDARAIWSARLRVSSFTVARGDTTAREREIFKSDRLGGSGGGQRSTDLCWDRVGRQISLGQSS